MLSFINVVFAQESHRTDDDSLQAEGEFCLGFIRVVFAQESHRIDDDSLQTEGECCLLCKYYATFSYMLRAKQNQHTC